MVERVTQALEESRQAHANLSQTVLQISTLTDTQFRQLGERQAELEAALSRQQDEMRQLAGRRGRNASELMTRIGQLAAQLAAQESAWQKRATTAELEARQLRRDLDAQGRLQQTLQQQLAEERKARKELAQQLGKLLQQQKEESSGTDKFNAP